MHAIDRCKFLIGSTVAAIVAPSLAIAAPTEAISQSVTINWPHMLATVLKSKHGVTILPPKYDQPMKRGVPIIPKEALCQCYIVQLPARDGILSFRSRNIFDLADAIAVRGKSVRFVPLILPKDAIDAENMKHDDVFMRYIQNYAIWTDMRFARLDVLFEVI